MNGTNYEVPHCGAFSTTHSHPSWAQIFASGSCFQNVHECIIVNMSWTQFLSYFVIQNNMQVTLEVSPSSSSACVAVNSALDDLRSTNPPYEHITSSTQNLSSQIEWPLHLEVASRLAVKAWSLTNPWWLLFSFFLLNDHVRIAFSFSLVISSVIGEHLIISGREYPMQGWGKIIKPCLKWVIAFLSQSICSGNLGYINLLMCHAQPRQGRVLICRSGISART